MVDRIGSRNGLASAAIEAALRRRSEALERLHRQAEEVHELASGQPRQAEKSSSFADELSEGVRALDASLKESESLAEAVIEGKVNDFHEVAALIKQTDLTFKFALATRNKLIDAYREVMRMSV